jgi:uncharacterized protein YndB with AHSA1/START domain
VKEPPQLVFQRYTEAEHLSAGGSTPPRAVIDKLDLRAGRRYRFVLHAPDGQQFAVRVVYLEIDCPHRLVKSFVYDRRARRTSSPAARRAYERQAELVASLQKGASPVSKQSCCGPSSRTPEHR